jgi:hypothetical protein
MNPTELVSLTFNDALGVFLSMFLGETNEVITSQTMCLVDRITLLRLKIPCRGLGCKHIQCFDYDGASKFLLFLYFLYLHRL